MEPSWCNRKFLQKAIRNYKADDAVEVLNYNTKWGFSEHFASATFQCQIVFKSASGEEETLNVVIKSQPTEDFKKELVSGGPLFENETKMYQETIPAIRRLLQASGLNVDIGPELIYATTDPFPIIILKDLSMDGFIAPRLPPDNVEDSKLIIQRLAQFHAASYYLAETGELDLTNYKYSIFENEFMAKTFFGTTIEIFREVLETWDGYKRFLPKIDFLIENLGEIGRQCYFPNDRSSGFNVLNHGDFHTRNILWKLNSEKRLEKFLFIDFQLSVFCSPAIDLAYINTMIRRDENGEFPFEEMVLFYHQEFDKTLKSFGPIKSAPTLIDLNVELIRYGRINVLLTINFLPFAFVDWEKMRIEELMGANVNSADAKRLKTELYNEPKCKKLMQKMLQTFEHNGWL